MGGKAKFQKHTAKELNAKQDQKNKGGGGAGIQTRLVAKLNFTCDICMVRAKRELLLLLQSRHHFPDRDASSCRETRLA